MFNAAAGLTDVETEALKRLLRAVYRQDIDCPLTIEALTRVGLQYKATELLAQLRDLDQRAVQAVLVCVLAERQAEARRRAAEAGRA